MKIVKETLKKIAFKYLKVGKPKYDYCVEPIQLATLVSELVRLDAIQGNILEIGVARGMTTRFLCEHLSYCKNFDGTYYAVDTFDSFTDEDMQFEVSNRGKSLADMNAFGYNDFNIWRSNFSEFSFVEAIKSDCSILDYTKLQPIKLTFLDVDLYLPTLKTLEKVYDSTIEGGVILIDDCSDNNVWDGAYQAYVEFCTKKNIEQKIIGNKCGVIYK